METRKYLKETNETILNSPLKIWWWNFGSKKVDFNGTAKEYLEWLNISYKITYKKFKLSPSSYYSEIKILMTFGQLNRISFTCRDVDVAISMVVSMRLAYLGDNSMFTFMNKTKKIKK